MSSRLLVPMLLGGLILACSSGDPLDPDGVSGDSEGLGGADGTGGAESQEVATVPNGPTGQGLDPSSGALRVHWPEWLSKQDVVYERPNAEPAYGLPVGNGRVGAMVWGEDELRLQVSGVDLSPQSTFAAGFASFTTSPRLASAVDAENYEQRLKLYDGELVTHFAEGLDVTVSGRADSEVLAIHVEDHRADRGPSRLDLGIWDLATLGNSAGVPDFDDWRSVDTFAEGAAAGFSRGRANPNGFGYTFAATVEGAPFQTEVVDARTVRLSIEASPSYTIWLVASARLRAPNGDSLTAARQALAQTAATGFAATRPDYQAFWHDFWARSFVQYTDGGDADYLEKFYYLASYVIAAGGFGDYPSHFINGVFRATGDETKWSSAYWFWNQRDVYASFLASDHPELYRRHTNLYVRNRQRLLDYTSERYDVAGLWVPETMGFDGNASGTVGSDFTQDILSTATEVALSLHAEYLHGGDDDYLSQIVYPFVRDAAQLYVGLFVSDAAEGGYYMPSSNAHETYWDVKNAITDLAAVRALFPVALELSERLGQDAELRPAWQSLLAGLVPYPEVDGIYAPHAPPIAQTRNNENVVCELIWPYSLGGIGSPDHDVLVSAFEQRPFPYGNVWANDAIQAARLGLGKETFQGARRLLQQYQTYPNGFTDNTNGVFEYWGVHLTTLNESLLQSHGGVIRVFPAVPPGDALTSRFSLHAEGGFVVTSERELSHIEYVALASERGERARVANPWPGSLVEVRELERTPAANDGPVIVESDSALIEFDTAAGGLYVLSPAGSPLSGYAAAHVDAEPASSALALGNGSTSLGIARYTPEQLGKYEAEDATLTDCNASGDPNASGGTQVINLKQGAVVSFAQVLSGVGLEIRYCTQNAPGRLALWIDGVKSRDLEFASTGSWDTNYSTLQVSVTVPEGATVELRYEAGGSGANLDYLQVIRE